MSQAAEAGLESPHEPSQGDSGGGATFDLGGSRLSRLGDWLNPVLVKEIRQGQRGKVFAVSLVLTVMLAFIACAMLALDIDGRPGQHGQGFFSVVFGFLCAAVVVIVPIQAFQSMGSEWDDHTFEMLVLSNLKPRQIVLGKILAAFVQSLLFTAAFLPFIAVAFLLRGVDMLALFLVLGLTAFASLWLTTVSIMLSTLTRNRFLRVVMLVVLAGSLISLVFGAGAISYEMMRRPDQLTDPEFWAFLPQLLGVFAFFGLLAFFISCNLLAHEEENRSTNVRVLISVGIFVLFAVLTANVTLLSTPMPREPVFGLAVTAIFFVAIAAVFFCTEPEKIGRRVAPTVPKSSVLAMLTFPWFPGRGRGTVFFLVHLAAIVVGAFAIGAVADPLRWRFGATPDDGLLETGGFALLVSVAYALIYTLFPIGVFSFLLAKSRRGRNVTRALALFSPIFYILLPSIFGLMVGSSSMSDSRHAGNGFWMIGEAFDGSLRDADEFIAVVLPLALVGLFIAFLAVFSALSETRTHSKANRRGESPLPEPPETPEAAAS